MQKATEDDANFNDLIKAARRKGPFYSSHILVKNSKKMPVVNVAELCRFCLKVPGDNAVQVNTDQWFGSEYNEMFQLLTDSQVYFFFKVTGLY